MTLHQTVGLVLLGAALAATGTLDATGAIIPVPAGSDLQAAIDRARPGDTLVLDAGAVYVGNFRLPAVAGDSHITITTRPAAGLPGDGVRIAPAQASRLAKLRSPNRQPVLRTAAGAHHWRLQLLEFLPTTAGHGEIIALGDGSSAQNDRTQAAREIVIDRCYIHGDPVKGQKRGIALNSAATTIRGSYIAEIKAVGMDAQAIAGWNGPGPYTIENNYLEAAAENFILGGADPAIQGLVTEDVVFRGNHLAKPLAWKDERWQVKNLFQLKNARRVLVEGNLMEYTWKDAQVGYAIVLSPRNQDGRAPWATVQDVTIRHNVVRHAGGGMQIIGEDDNHPSGSTSGITIVDNLFYGIDAAKWGGTGAFVLIGEGPSAITIEHNTVSQSGNIVMAYGGKPDAPKTVRGFVFRGNAIRHNKYGVHGASRAPGQDSLDAFFPGAVFSGNVIAGGSAKRYPGGNTFVEASEFDALFADAAAGDFTAKRDSRLAVKGSRAAGADVRAVFAAVKDLRVTSSPPAGSPGGRAARR
jgi:hypothetical protein